MYGIIDSKIEPPYLTTRNNSQEFGCDNGISSGFLSSFIMVLSALLACPLEGLHLCCLQTFKRLPQVSLQCKVRGARTIFSFCSSVIARVSALTSTLCVTMRGAVLLPVLLSIPRSLLSFRLTQSRYIARSRGWILAPQPLGAICSDNCPPSLGKNN